MDCRLSNMHMGAYMDGELAPTAILEFEAHMEACGACHDEQQAMRALKDATLQALRGPDAPGSLRLKVQRGLDQADGRRSDDGVMQWAGSLATAAVVLLALMRLGNPVDGLAEVAPQVERATAVSSPIFEDVVNRHTDPLPSEITPTEPDGVTTWFRGKVGFQVRSVKFDEPRVQLVGARVTHVGRDRAARLSYQIGDRRLTMMMFRTNPNLHQEIAQQAVGTAGIQRRQVGTRTVTYRNVHGYTVPIIERDGVAYMFIGDMDRDELLKLVGGAQLP